jgi:glycosyltransferase involved in cell wall biosynthesis
MLSIVTGTLERRHLLPGLIANTVDANEQLELVLVDGGSTDGTIDYIKGLNHPRIKLIEVGHRSPYPHYMNLGIRNASYDYICQWNDDVLLLNSWNEVIILMQTCDACLFSWQHGELNSLPNSWNLMYDKTADPKCGNEVVMNYGTYKKEIFKKIGMYDNSYLYRYVDGDMSFRAWSFGFKVYPAYEIKVLSLLSELNTKRMTEYPMTLNPEDLQNYANHLAMYRRKELSTTAEFL